MGWEMKKSYWQRALAKRTGRRPVLAGIGAGAVAALAAACGGSSKSKKPQAAASGLLAPETTTTDRAVRGGTMITRTTFDPLNLDGNGSGGNVNVRSAVDLAYRQ